jgi:hypothetical protein
MFDTLTIENSSPVVNTGDVDLPIPSGKPRVGGVKGFDKVTQEAELAYSKCIALGLAIVDLELSKEQKLCDIINAIRVLTKKGHQAYRVMLSQDLSMIKAMGEVDTVKSMRGYTLASYSVMVSNWKTISVAFENGMVYDKLAGWHETLKAARAARASTGETKSGPKTGTKQVKSEEPSEDVESSDESPMVDVEALTDKVHSALLIVQSMTPDELIEFMIELDAIKLDV